jgi:phosphate transport system substrate-binding protein
MKLNTFLSLCFACAFLGCNSGNNGKTYTDTPNSGEINISVDESFKPLVKAELDVFHALYPDAHINVSYKPESEALKDLFNDSARLVFVTRDLTAKERERFEAQKLYPRAILVAHDGIALIINNKNAGTVLTRQQLIDILSGKVRRWDQLPGFTSKDSIRIVFDNEGSGTVRYLKDSLVRGRLSDNTFALNSNPEVIDYVEDNPEAIGVISNSWVSDLDDTVAHTFLNRVRVLNISDPERSSDAYSPHKGYVAQKVYPLWRNLYIISREARTGLGTGFASFVASDRGQTIVLKAGLVPATMPVRLISTEK